LSVEEQVAEIRERTRIAALAGNIMRLDGTVTPDRVDLRRWQSPAQPQLDRGTCYAFATVAAMEARYRRDHGQEIGLSEEYALHINKVGELLDDYMTSSRRYENNSTFWGFQGGSGLTTKFERTALCERSIAPYFTQQQLVTLRDRIPAAGSLDERTATQENLDAFDLDDRLISPAARQSARYRITRTRELPGPITTAALEEVLSRGQEVVVDIPGHCVLFYGYDRPARQWLVKDSAGGVFTRYPYTEQILGGYVVMGVSAPTGPIDLAGRWLGRWNMDHDGWRGVLLIRRTTNYRRPSPGQPTKLGDYVRQDGRRFAVNGATRDDGRQLHFWIANREGKVEPGASVGQEFRVWMHGRQPNTGAGTTTWNSIPFGVTVSRDAIRDGASSGSPGTWNGAWDLVHDGWRGVLDIHTTRPFSGSYLEQNGVRRTVTGTVDANHGHRLSMTIDFGGHRQPFTLLLHTREQGRCSGTTVWQNATFGVSGQRRAAAG
jgi:hypothetical protein